MRVQDTNSSRHGPFHNLPPFAFWTHQSVKPLCISFTSTVPDAVIAHSASEDCKTATFPEWSIGWRASTSTEKASLAGRPDLNWHEKGKSSAVFLGTGVSTCSTCRRDPNFLDCFYHEAKWLDCLRLLNSWAKHQCAPPVFQAPVFVFFSLGIKEPSSKLLVCCKVLIWGTNSSGKIWCPPIPSHSNVGKCQNVVFVPVLCNVHSSKIFLLLLVHRSCS